MAPYRIGNTATLKIAQKDIKNTRKIQFSVFLVYFCAIFLVGAFSYSVGGQVFRKVHLCDLHVITSVLRRFSDVLSGTPSEVDFPSRRLSVPLPLIVFPLIFLQCQASHMRNDVWDGALTCNAPPALSPHSVNLVTGQ